LWWECEGGCAGFKAARGAAIQAKQLAKIKAQITPEIEASTSGILKLEAQEWFEGGRRAYVEFAMRSSGIKENVINDFLAAYDKLLTDLSADSAVLADLVIKRAESTTVQFGGEAAQARMFVDPVEMLTSRISLRLQDSMRTTGMVSYKGSITALFERVPELQVSIYTKPIDVTYGRFLETPVSEITRIAAGDLASIITKYLSFHTPSGVPYIAMAAGTPFFFLHPANSLYNTLAAWRGWGAAFAQAHELAYMAISAAASIGEMALWGLAIPGGFMGALNAVYYGITEGGRTRTCGRRIVVYII
jgi:hypothetical protein